MRHTLLLAILAGAVYAAGFAAQVEKTQTQVLSVEPASN